MRRREGCCLQNDRNSLGLGPRARRLLGALSKLAGVSAFSSASAAVCMVFYTLGHPSLDLPYFLFVFLFTSVARRTLFFHLICGHRVPSFPCCYQLLLARLSLLPIFCPLLSLLLFFLLPTFLAHQSSSKPIMCGPTPHNRSRMDVLLF